MIQRVGEPPREASPLGGEQAAGHSPRRLRPSYRWFKGMRPRAETPEMTFTELNVVLMAGGAGSAGIVVLARALLRGSRAVSAAFVDAVPTDQMRAPPRHPR